jgi:hypothetical protein
VTGAAAPSPPRRRSRIRASVASLTTPPRPIHPILFAAFPVLFLFASNLGQQIEPADALTQVVIMVVSTALVALVATAALGDARRGALLATLWLALFFGYGHVWNLVRAAGGVGLEGWLLLAWALLAVGAVILAATAGRWLSAATRGLNAAAVVLVVLNVVALAAGAAGGGPATGRVPGEAVILQPQKDSPDIYYIVMDRYGGAETLRERFGFDNGPFLRALEERGFYVPSDSTANYPKTAHSLATSLNMGYLDFLTSVAGRGSDDWNPVYDLLSGFRVSRALQSAGYRYVHIGSRWDPTRVDPFADVNEVSSGMSEFAQVLYGSSLLSPLARRTGVLDESLDPRERERDRILFQFDRVAAARDVPGPTFVFAHLLLPHEPYLFEAGGGEVTEAEEQSRTLRQKFIGQVRYANRRLLALFDLLLDAPAGRRPVIILQADEGPHPPGYLADEVHYDWTGASDSDLEGKFRILNAYHLPGITDRTPAFPEPSRAGLYPTISPVNSFRIVFNAYFDAGLPLLPDRSYVFLDEEHLYDFVEVTGRLRGS